MFLLVVACVTPGPAVRSAPELLGDTGAPSTDTAPDTSGDTSADTSADTTAADVPTVRLVSGSACTSPCTFSAEVTGDVARLTYDADGYPLGSATPAHPSIAYDFTSFGDRAIRVTAYDADGVQVADDLRTVTVSSLLPDVPYFYQYDNDLYPSSTCQNTSIAMLLAAYGWRGEPDDITAVYGKDTAQTVAGLASVFNDLAAASGLSPRLTGHTDGTLADVDALLDRGLPVIVHGYFTSSGHVMVILGYDADGYWVNDPAGTWDEDFMGGYPGAYEPTAGDGIYYRRAAFEAAIATWDGRTTAPIWYHELR